MPLSAGRQSLSTFDSHSSDSELRRYVMRSTDDLGKGSQMLSGMPLIDRTKALAAYNQVEQRMHDFGKQIDEKLRPDLEDVRGQATSLEPRVSRLEELIAPYNVYESDVKKAVKKLKAVEGKVESALSHNWGPSQVDLEVINHKIESLANAITTLTNTVNDISSTVNKISDVQKENDTALRQGFASLDQKATLLKYPAARAMSSPDDQIGDGAEMYTHAAGSHAYKAISDSWQSPSSVIASPPSGPAMNDTRLASQSINDVGRDFLSRLSQGQEIDRGVLQRLATHFSSMARQVPTNSLDVEQPSVDTPPEARRSGRQTSGLTRESVLGGLARSPSRKRRCQEDGEDSTKSQKKSRIEDREDPLPACDASVKARNAAPHKEKTTGPKRSRIPATRSKTKQAMVPNTSDTDNDADDDSPSSPRPRRTSRAIKPTERAGDFMKIRP